MATKPEAKSQSACELAAELDSINLHTRAHGPASRQSVAKILTDHEEKCLKRERARPKAHQV